MTDKIILDESFTATDDHTSVECKADALEITVDPSQVGAGPAAAIAAAITASIKGITQRARDGKHMLFNRTGTLANGITAQPDGDDWAIVPPDGYLEDPALQQRLIDTVDAVASPLSQPSVQTAIEKSAADMVKKA